jgi:uncharacterized protein YjbI with pentapeptide repeats
MKIAVHTSDELTTELIPWELRGRRRVSLAVTMSWSLDSGGRAAPIPVPSPLSTVHLVPYKHRADILVTGEPAQTARRLLGVAIARGTRTLFAKRVTSGFAPPVLEHGPQQALDDPFAFQAAPDDQRAPYLLGGEQLLLQVGNRTSHHRLPGVAPFATHLSTLGERRSVPLVGDTAVVDLEGRICSLTWRGVLPEDVTDGTIDVAALPLQRTEEIAGMPSSWRRAPHHPRPEERERIELINDTPFPAVGYSWCPSPGEWRHTVVVKGTFTIDPTPQPLAQQPPLQGDLLAGTNDPDPAALPACIYTSDFAPFKPRTDVLVRASAHAPEGESMAIVRLRFGDVDKQLVALGPRRWRRDGIPSEPEPFDSVPLDHTMALRGPDNPAGLVDEPPRVEHTDRLLRQRGDELPPASLGPIAPGWKVRTKLLGDLEADADHARALPKNADLAYFNAAPRDQQLPHLTGGESFTVSNVRPGPESVRGTVPRTRPVCHVLRAETIETVDLVLDTVTIDCEKSEIVVVWRGITTLADEDGSDVSRILVHPTSLSAIDAWARLTTHGDERFVAEASPAPTHTPFETPAVVHPTMPGPRAPRPAPPPTRAQITAWIAGDELRERDLTGAQLDDLDFSGRDLSGAILTDANLDRCVFDGAKLQQTVLTRVRGESTRWRGADLIGADLSHAGLPTADFEDANLTRASAPHIHLAGAVLRRAQLDHADLSHADLTDVDLEASTLTSATLSHAVLERVRLTRADLAGGKLFEVTGSDVILDEAHLERCQLERAILPRLSARGIHADSSRWEGAKLQRAVFGRADLRAAGFKRSRLDATDFTSADLTEADLSRASLDGAILRRTNLMNALLDRADLSGADTEEANLYGAIAHGSTRRRQ